ncbi:MAG: hypothetical protein FJ279_02100 [Planctomycetes bacterium]|nr:hypothetical protein [Planctomycetota bacterium]
MIADAKRIAELEAEIRRFRAALEAHEEVKAKLQTEVARLGAESAALDWCRGQLADIEFNQYSGKPAEVRVKVPLDPDGDFWREATAPTLEEAVAELRKGEADAK